MFGLDPFRLRSTLRGLPYFLSDYRKLRRQYQQSRREFPMGAWYPIFDERFVTSGTARGQYFHQDLLVAQWIYADRPERHVDVGSRIDGFVAHVAVFREIEVFDIRPQIERVGNIRFRQCDFTLEPFPFEGCTDSASCLHALEHFGLGRYGDRVDYYGYLRGWENLQRLVRPDGRLYFSVPMGPARIEFNGHRIFSAEILGSMIDAKWRVERFAYVDDAGDLHTDVDWQSPAAATNFGCNNGCAIFTLRKVR